VQCFPTFSILFPFTMHVTLYVKAVSPFSVYFPYVHAYIFRAGEAGEAGEAGLMETYGDLWRLMETYGDLWRLMETYGDLWRLRDLWRLMETYGDLWRLMETYFV